MRTASQRQFIPLRMVLCGSMISILCGCHAVNGYVMNESGRAYLQRGNYWMARQDFQRAVIDNPHNINYLHNLACAMQHQGDLAGAERVYRQALNLDPAHQPTYHAMAALLNDQKRQAEALDLMQTWVATQPYRPESHIEMAWLQQEIGDWAGAERSLRYALSIDPNNHIATAHLGQVYQRAGQPRQALALYQRSLATRWNQPRVHSRVASLNQSLAMTPPPMAHAMPQTHVVAAPVGRYAVVPVSPTPGQPMTTLTQRPPVRQPSPAPTALAQAPPASQNYPIAKVPPAPAASIPPEPDADSSYNADPAHVPRTQTSQDVPVVAPH